MYLEALIYNIEYQNIEEDMEYRNKLYEIEREQGLSKLYEMASKIDSKAMEKISPNDKREFVEYWKFIILLEKLKQN